MFSMKGFSSLKVSFCLKDRDVNVFLNILNQGINENLTLLISKVSEAVLPLTKGNEIGEGANIDEIIKKQKGVRFVINGGFNHYRKDFYDWSHQDFNVGDPVGLVKIRNHYYEDLKDIEYYGFFVQKEKNEKWEIKKINEISKSEKYILGCTPLLIYKNEKINLPLELMMPIKEGKVNPPSILGHGLQNHPRTAVGVKNNNIFFITTEDDCSLLELQEIGVELGLSELLNLDGGGSSQFRLFDNENYIKNNVAKEDEKRVLGNVLIVFDESLK